MQAQPKPSSNQALHRTLQVPYPTVLCLQPAGSQTALQQLMAVSPQIRIRHLLSTRPLAKYRVQPLPNGRELPKSRRLGFQQGDDIQVQLQHRAVIGRVISLE